MNDRIAENTVELKRRLKETEKALYALEEKYRLLSENTSDVISILDENRTYSYISPSVKHTRGFEPEEVIGKPLSEMITPASLEKTKRLYSGTELKPAVDDADSKPPRTLELEMYKKDGSTIWSESRVFLLRDEDGRHSGYMNVSRDIDEKKKIYGQLQESEEKYRAIIENIEEGYYEVDLSGNFTFFNKPICRIAAISCQELKGVNFRAYTSAEGARRLFKIFSSIYKTGRPTSAFELKIYRLDGESRHVEISASLITDSSGNPVGFRGIMRDVTERKKSEEEKARLEAQLMHAHKMEAVGTLAGGVAHDFNNILQAINGYAQLLLLSRAPDDPDYDKLLKLQAAGERAALLVQQLLTFSRRAAGERRLVSLNREIVTVKALLDQTLPKMIEIRLDMDEDLWLVNADPMYLEQVLLNLASNAADAMPDGGRLTIETRNIVLDELYCSGQFECVPGNYVMLSVSDTGCGMDPETVTHIFDPFYTTKAVGKGTGLGLASVYGIVKDHGGLIHCYSEIGQGSVFRIYLPAALRAEGVGEKKQTQPAVPAGGKENILVIDDEPTVREMAKEMLEYYGYHVICAENGESAIKVYQENMPNIQLVILDLNMPGMGGYKCMQQLLDLDTQAKILIASGYATDSHARKALASGAASFIGKPYHLHEMARKVRSALDGVCQ